MSNDVAPLSIPAILTLNPGFTLAELAVVCDMPQSETDVLAAGWLAIQFQEAVRRQATEAFRIRRGTEIAINHHRCPIGYYTVELHYADRSRFGIGIGGIALINVIQKGRKNPQRFVRVPAESCTVVPNWCKTFAGWTGCPSIDQQLAGLAAMEFPAFGWHVLCDMIQDHPNWFVWEEFYSRGFSIELFASAIRKTVDEGHYCGASLPTAAIIAYNANPERQ